MFNYKNLINSRGKSIFIIYCMRLKCYSLNELFLDFLSKTIKPAEFIIYIFCNLNHDDT